MKEPIYKVSCIVIGSKCTPPIAANLRSRADGSAVRTALMAWPGLGLGAARLAQVGPTDG